MRILTTSLLFLGAALLLSADTVTLKDGRTYSGTYLGGTARQIRLDLNGTVQTFEIGDVQSIVFNDAGAAMAAPPSQPSYGSQPNYPAGPNGRPTLVRGGVQNPPPQPPPPMSGVTIPIDTLVEVRMIEAVDSERAHPGQTFRASLDQPIFVNGQEIVPRGADVLTKLTEDQSSGRISGRSILSLSLAQIMINGRMVDVISNDVQQQSSSRGARSAKVIGGTAALGAIVGAIAGGGKGAAIGAGSGAAVGTGAEVLTGGQKVKIPSETRLTFRLHDPVTL